MIDRYYLYTKTRHEIEIGAETRRKVQSAIARGTKHITVEGNMIATSDIAGIYDEPKPRNGQYRCKFGTWHADNETCGCHELAQQRKSELHDRKQLQSARSACRGQYSIQREINNIARHEHQVDWSKYIQSKTWRKQMRLELLKQTNEWCDYQSGRCVCDQGYLSQQKIDMAGVV